MEYGSGLIRLETQPVPFITAGLGIGRTEVLNIMDLGEEDMLIGYDWLIKYNPAIDWQKMTIRGREPARKVANVRQKSSPTIQSSPQTGRIGKISPHKIARIYEKDPKRVGVIWIRRVASAKDGPLPAIPKEYNTDEFRELFEETEATELADHQEWDHEIHLEEGAKLSPGPMYPVSQDQEEELRKFLKKNLGKGFIRESNSPMASPILFVRKKNGSLRLCVDYRRLNNLTRKNRYPLPLITELMDRLQGAKWFTKFDVREGFYRIRIAKGFEWLTAFKTRYGLYEFTVMPMGLTNAPATFQSVINKALHEYLDIFVTAYLDDVLVYSRGTLEEHIEHVKKVLRKLKECKLYLQPGKCEFHTKETDFLGFIISTEGVKMDPKKVQTVQEWPKPKTVKDVQSFLGFANYYRRFIKHYSRISAPLTEVTKKEKGFHWSKEQEDSFQRLKAIFLTAPVLAMYDPRKPTRAETDASDYALGAVLTQQSEDGKWRPVFYHSRKFSGAELNYDVHDKELLGVVDSLEQWDVYLIGLPQTFDVYTDHQNLTSFMTTKKLNRRQVRWAERLADYDFKIIHRPGSLNGAADALSRRSDLREDSTSISHDPVLRKEPDGSLRYNHPQLARVAAFGQRVTTLETEWKNKASAHRSDSGDDTPSDAQERRSLKDETRTFVPQPMRRNLIRDLHESREYGHAGLEEMIRRLNKVFAIPRLRAQVQYTISNCLECSMNKPKRHKPYGLLQPLTPPQRPWTSVTMDFIVKLPKSREPGSARLCDTVLVIVDRLTKAAKFVPTEESITAEECAYEVTKALVSEHGVPEEFITDRDKLFTSKYWTTFLAKLGIKKKLSTSFHPETDGQTERTNQTLEVYLRMYANKLQDNWVELLPTAQLAYNSTRSATTKQSPHYANYGYEPTAHRDPKDIESTAVGADDKARLLRDLHDELSKNIAHRNLTTSRSANKQRIEGPTFKKGDKVFLSRQNLKTKRPSRKLDNLRIGPFEVLEAIGPVNYRLQLPKGMRIHPVFHKKLLEPAPPDAAVATDIELEDEEYTVEEIKDLRKNGRQQEYLVKWQGWPEAYNTWEPERNLTNCKELVTEYHQRHPQQQNRAQERNRGKKTSQDPARDQRMTRSRKNQPVTSPDQPMVRIALVRWQKGPYPEQSSPQPTLSPGPEDSESRDRDRRIRARAPPPQVTQARAEPAEPSALRPQGASHASPPAPSPILPQKQTGYTQPSQQCSQRNGQWQYPRSTEDSSPHTDHTETTSPGPSLLSARNEHDAPRSRSAYVDDETGWTLAWLGRHGGRGAYDATGIPRFCTEGPPRNAARNNEIPGYRDDNPKEGDSVTSEQTEYLPDEDCEVEGQPSHSTQDDDQRGALRIT
jgi:hypothetical protein